MKKNILIVAGCMLVLVQALQAQGINSIYSAYGIGDLNVRDFNAYTPMGGLGIAISSERSLNDLNPASYGGLTQHRHLLEIGAAGKTINYVTADQNLSAGYFGVKRAAFGMNLFKNLGTVIGIRQFSQVSYKSAASRYVIGTASKLTEEIEGDGGLNMAYLSNGYNIGKHLSLGVTTGIIFGSVNKKENIYMNETSGISVETNAFYNKFYLNTGLQYKFKTGKYNWILGGTFQPEISLKKINNNYIKDLSDVTLLEDNAISTKFKYPLQWGAGITVSKAHSQFGVDMIQQNWASTGYKGTGFTSKNLQNFAVGYKYTFLRKTYYGPVEGASLMLGAQHDRSYLVINNQEVNTTAATLGVNFPSKNNMFNYTIGIRAGQRGRIDYPLVKEKFVDFTFNVSLGNIFYIGGRKYD